MFKLEWKRNPLKDWVYRIGVKRRFLPGYRKFRVLKHTPVWMDGKEGVKLQLAKGGFVSIAAAEFKVYPEYDAVMGLHRQMKEDQEAQALEAEAGREKIRTEALQNTQVARQPQVYAPPAPVVGPGPVVRNDIYERAAKAARATIGRMNAPQ